MFAFYPDPQAWPRWGSRHRPAMAALRSSSTLAGASGLPAPDGSHRALAPALRLTVWFPPSASPQSSFSRNERRRLGPVISYQMRRQASRLARVSGTSSHSQAPALADCTCQPAPVVSASAGPALPGRTQCAAACPHSPRSGPPGAKPPFKSECASSSSGNSPWTCSGGSWACSCATLPP